MDEYKASVQGVDDALARLNATLASYKLSGNLPKKPSADPVTQPSVPVSSTTENASPIPEEARGTLKHHVFQVVSKVTSEPVDWETWNALSDDEALQKYPEVRHNPSESQYVQFGSLMPYRSRVMISGST